MSRAGEFDIGTDQIGEGRGYKIFDIEPCPVTSTNDISFWGMYENINGGVEMAVNT